MRAIALAVAALLIVPAAPASAMTTDRYEHRVVRAINAAREPDVRRSRCVDRFALAHARALRGRPYGTLSHLDLASTAYACGGYRVGEVIGRTINGPRAQVRFWLELSPPHRRVVMNHRYRKVGIATVHDGDRWLTVVQFVQP